MKLMKGTRDKKGQVYFSAMLALVVIPILLITVAYANVKQIEPLNTPIGRDASAVLEGSYETNNALTYIRESASLASEQAIYDLTQVGGGSECGSIRGYSYWSKACFSPYQKEYFNLLFTSYLDDFLRNYPDTNIPLNNYDITLSKDMLIGSAKNPLSIYLEGTKDNYIGYYTSRPSFSIQNKIDMLKTFSDLRFFIIDSETEAGLVYNTVKCRDDPDSQNELSTCIATAVAKLEPLIPFDIIYNQISEHVVTFDLQSQERLIAYDPDDNAIQSRNIIIKFAIDFSKTEETEATNMGEPVIIQPKVIIAQGVDPKCPTQVEDIPGYIDCISQYYCKLSPEANNKIKDAQQQASDLYGYRLEILEAYRTYDQYYTYGGRAPSILTTDEEGCNIPEIQGKSVSVTFKGVDMAETPSTEYNHPERAKLKTAMEAAGWVNVPGDYTKYECCGTELYNKNRYPDIDYTGASGSGTTGALPALGSLPFEYTPVAEPGIDQKVTVRGVSPDDVVVYLHDVWEIAQKENVNYYLILSIMATESNFQGKYLNRKNDGLAHGVMQMFKPATRDIYKALQPQYMKLNSYSADSVQEYIFTSPSREDVKIQIHAGTLYIKKVRQYLITRKVAYDVNSVIQAYHDGSGFIQKDGSSTFCTVNSKDACQESEEYLPKTLGFYAELTGTASSTG